MKVITEFTKLGYNMCLGENINTLCSRTDERVTTRPDGTNDEVQVNLAGLLAAERSFLCSILG